MKASSFTGRVKQEWVKAGKPNWTSKELLAICLLIDFGFSIEGLNPAQKFRQAIEAKDLSYLMRWSGGLKFSSWKH